MSATLTFAFGAGALSTVNPCGFALLPAFLAYYLGQEASSARPALAGRLTRGVRAGIALSAGYAGVFTVAGLLLAAGLRLLIGVVPWVAVLVGGALVALGLVLMAGRTVGLRVDATALTRNGDRAGLRGVVVFGAAYAIASLSCTLAVLLAVVGQALASADVLAVVAVFAAYAAGAASVLVLLAVSAALASGALARAVRRALPFVGRLSGAVLVISGVYLVAYWLPQLAGDRSGTPLSRGGATIAGVITGWLEGHVGLVASAAAVVLTVIAALAATGAARRQRAPRATLSAGGVGDTATAGAAPEASRDCCAEPSTPPTSLGRSGATPLDRH